MKKTFLVIALLAALGLGAFGLNNHSIDQAGGITTNATADPGGGGGGGN